MTCRVYVVSDRPAAGRYLARALADDELSCEWSTLDGLLSTARDTVDLVVLHAHSCGSEVARSVVEVREHILGPVIVVTPDAREATLMKPLAAGAQGVVLRTSRTDLLKRAVHVVRSGGMFIDPILGATLADLVTVNARTDGDTDLTRTELRVLQRFPQGMSNATMAEDLDVSLNTIKTHVRHILAKLECDNRLTAIKLAKQQGLLP
ncbi:MAG: DNA-binding NarL/FixJ family response regulator [Glaciecola sp.]